MDQELLERDGELEALADVITRAEHGRGTLVLVEAAPGMGKSRLLREARRMAEERAVAVLLARGGELEREMPFALARQILTVDSFPEGISLSTDRGGAFIGRLHEALLNLLFDGSQSVMAPHLLLIDDAHWADAESLRFVAHLALRIESLPLAAVVALRSGDPLAPAELAALRPASQKSLQLAPLSRKATDHLIRTVCGQGVGDEFVAACADSTGGNPFYLHELLRDLVQSGSASSVASVQNAAPESVLNAVLARLAQLGPHHAALAGAVAVLGDGVPVDLAAEMASLSITDAEAAADGLAKSNLFEPGEPLRMAHPLIASTLRKDMGTFAESRAHARAADLLANRSAPVELVAAHLLYAPPSGDSKHLDYLRRGAALSRSHGAPETAARLLRRAMEEKPDGATTIDLHVELAHAMAEAGDPGAIEELEVVLGKIPESQRRAAVLCDLSMLMHHAGEFETAADLARRGRSDADPDGRLNQRLLAAFVAAGVLHPPLVKTAMYTLEELLAAARSGVPPSDPYLLALAASYSASAGAEDDFVRSLALSAFAANPVVDPASCGTALGFGAQALVSIDALDEAERLMEAASAEADRRGAVLTTSIAAHYLAQINYHRGRLDEAVAYAELSLESHRNGWVESAWSTPILAQAYLALGNIDAAEEAVAVGERGDPARVEHALLLEARAALSLAKHDPAAALADARAASSHIGDNFSFLPARTFELPRLAAIAAHQLGDQLEAERLIDERLDLLRVLGTRRQLGTTLMTAGMIKGGDGGLDLMLEAVEVLRVSPSRLELAEALVELGSGQRRLGRRSSAKETLFEALEFADSCGSLPLVQRARSELASLGFRPRRSARSGVDALTPSERRVAELAATGLSTPQIAHSLRITRKTVESHLYQAYRKLHISSRSELQSALGAIRSG